VLCVCVCVCVCVCECVCVCAPKLVADPALCHAAPRSRALLLVLRPPCSSSSSESNYGMPVSTTSLGAPRVPRGCVCVCVCVCECESECVCLCMVIFLRLFRLLQNVPLN